MKVLFITPKIMDESLSASTRLGVIGALAQDSELTLVARYRSPRTSHGDDIDILPIRAPRMPVLNMLWFMLAATRSARKELLQGNPDVVLIEPLAVWPVVIARILTRDKTPVVLDMRTLPIEARGWRAKADVFITRVSLRRARSICASYTAITPGVAAWTSQLVDVPTSEIAIWGTGVDPQVFELSRYAQRSDGDSTFKLLYHGALYDSRGLGSLIRAMTLLSGDCRNFTQMRIVGEGPDRQQLSDLVNDLGLTDKVSVEGRVPLSEIPAAIASSDAGIIPLPDLPCWRTSSPTKLFELLSMQTPVIATSIDAHRMVLADSNAVVWAGQGSPEEIATAICAAYDSRENLARAARDERERHILRYSWDAQVRILLDRLRAVARN